MTPFVNDPDFTLHVGDALETLQAMPAESVHCCVTSPPYWGLRDYGTGAWEGGDTDCDHSDAVRNPVTVGGFTGDRIRTNPKEATKYQVWDRACKCGARRVDQQLGLEPTPDEYVASMVAVFREVRRVLRADGTLWLNIGDSYSGSGRGPSAMNPAQEMWNASVPAGLKPKDLVGIPWRLAFALQADGWYLRSDIIWAKPNPMPESVTDRPTKAHEYLFLLTKSPRYFYDADAIREAHSPDMRAVTTRTVSNGSHANYQEFGHEEGRERWPNGGRNKRSVWEIATEAYPDAHFATFPQALVEPCIKAGTSEHGCCPECGAPWVRILEKSGAVKNRDYGEEAYAANTGRKRTNSTLNGTPPTSETIGWRPNCLCPPIEKGVLPDRLPRYETPIPAVVLDPFLGSGTTAQVARRLGRRSIGIELNPEYAKLAAKRLQQQTLFACVVDESAGLAEDGADRV